MSNENFVYPGTSGVTVRADEEHGVMVHVVHLSDKALEDVRRIVREEITRTVAEVITNQMWQP